MTIIEMKEKLAKTLDASKELIAENKFEEAQAKVNEAQAIKATLEFEEKLDAEEKKNVASKATVSAKKTAIEQFGADVKKSFRAAYTGQTEGTNADGGYVVPKDVDTKIREYMQAKANLLDYITIENVNSMSGSRTYATKDSQVFSAVNEAAAIGALTKRQFQLVSYTIHKYAGIAGVTNELLADADSSLGDFLVRWLADCKRRTINQAVVTLAKTNTSTAIADADDIKEALNSTLGATYKPTSVIVTNDDGINWLDQLKYTGDGHYMLSYDVTKPNVMRLVAGGIAVPVVNIPNADMATVEGVAPIIIGDLKAGITMFDRNQLTVTRSDIATVGGVSAFENDLTYIRGVMRADFQKVDAAAFVNGAITLGE